MFPTGRLAWVLAVAALGLLSTAGAQAAVWFVDGGALGGGDGQSWTTAYRHPQTAMAAATSGDEIWVREGTYGVRSAGDPSVVVLGDGVALYGAFDGTETSLAQRDTTIHETVLDGGGTTEHVVVGADAARLDGFTVTGGAPYTVCCLSVGAGMLMDGVATTVSHVLFRDNSSHQGAAIRMVNASPLIEHSRFEDNAAEIAGGAVSIQGGLPVIRSSTFLRNRAVTTQGQGGAGGAVWLQGGSITVEDSHFEGNHAEFDGGAIQAGGDFVIRRSSFVGNYAATGGAIRAESAFGFLTVEDSDFDGNFNTTTTRIVCEPFEPFCYPIQYGGTGGAIYDHESGVQVQGSTFTTNDSRQGGAVYVERAAPDFDDCTFTGNTALYYGGAFHSAISAPVIERSTFSGNAASSGGALYVEAQLSGQQSIRVRDSLFQQNSASGSGGAMTIAVAYGEIERSRFLDNEAASNGGAIYAYDNTGVRTSFTFRNLLLAGNRAAIGGALANASACIRATLVNATFADNEATVQGGALDNAACTTSTYTNVISWGNTAPTSPEIAGSAAVTYSDVEGGFAGAGNLALDPLFLAPGAGDYRLAPGSPAIDTGTDSGAPADDLDGLPRPFDGDGDGTPITDMGAYEYRGATCGDADGDGVCDGADDCIFVPDPAQTDTDADGFGNACDCDFDQDGACNIADFNLFLPDFAAGTDGGAGTDMDTSGSVSIGDFNLFLPGFVAGAPGPSGSVP